MSRLFAAFMRPLLRGATQSCMQAVAVRTVEELQRRGPYWDGYFFHAWDCVLGNVNIPADQKGGRRSESPGRRPAADASFVPPANIDYGYTIGNRMEYRAVAMDLEPGRIKGGGNETAPQDWFTRAFQGGEILRIVGSAADDGFRRGFARGALRVIGSRGGGGFGQ